MNKLKLMISCEHGGNDIPQEYHYLFENAQNIIESHRGYDYGALLLYNHICHIADYTNYATTSRLLIDLNRSLGHPSLFSEFTNNLDGKTKLKIIHDFYDPYRNCFANFAKQCIDEGFNIMLLSIHSFTPLYNGTVRNTDVGILFDPDSRSERNYAARLKHAINKLIPHIRVRFNYPYKGKPDGHVAYFRRRYGERFTGIEFEMGYNLVYPEMLNLLSKAIISVNNKRLKY